MHPSDATVCIEPELVDVVKSVGDLGHVVQDQLVCSASHAAALARVGSSAQCGDRDAGWDTRPHPILEAAAPTLEQFEHPDTAPVAIMRNPVAGKQIIAGSNDLSTPVPINTQAAIPFESPLMVGKFILHIRGLKSSNESLFAGKKRFLHIAIQGRLKRDMKASDIWTGHEWSKVSDLVPTSFISVAYTAAAKMMSSTTRVCGSTENGKIAGFLNPMLASCQIYNVSLPGQEPDIWEAQEDARLLSPQLADDKGNPLSSDKRRHWFDNPANAASVVLSTEYVYTIHSWQHWCNIAKYRLQLSSLLSFDLCQFSTGQPLQIMAKDTESGEYLINLLLWHKNLLYKDKASTTSSSSSSDTLGIRDKLKCMKQGWQGLLTGKQ